jgi:NAD-dependent SIR2 family protein deacetylase
LAELYDFVRRYPRLFILSGAGISTDSGIPGYRDADGQWMRTPPVMLADFLRSEAVRQRYWARSMVGWPVVARARPNAAHLALVRIEAVGRMQRLATQNVDGLHQRAGSTNVIELHGNIGMVSCIDCAATYPRASIQRVLEIDNAELTGAPAAPAADGDANLEWYDLEDFRVPRCTRCAGLLKPDVVFFGESVPRARIDAAIGALERADAMLILGSSLMVYSGYRFCELADKLGKPMAAINLGRTRADHLLSLKIEAPCATTLTSLAERLGAA